MKSTPLPRWLILGNSAVIVGISAVLAGIAIGGMAAAWDSCSVFYGLILLLLTLVVGCLQYAAGFCNSVWAASKVADCHLVAFVLSSVGLTFAILVSSLYEVDFRWEPIAELLIAIGFNTYFGFCAWMNFRLRNSILSEPNDFKQPKMSDTGRFQVTLREFMGGTLVVAIVASTAAYIIRDSSVQRDSSSQYEEQITREQAPEWLQYRLPKGATDISYAKGARVYLVYEFTIDEAGFLDWAEGIRENYSSFATTSNNEIQKGGPFAISRYTWFIFGEDNQATIPTGYFCEISTAECGIKLGYDPAKQRAYYFRF